MKHFCVDGKLKHFSVDKELKHNHADQKARRVCLELKVCEGCGGLWLRAALPENPGVYCRSCALRLSDFPAPRGRSRAGRKPKVGLLVCEGGAK